MSSMQQVLDNLPSMICQQAHMSSLFWKPIEREAFPQNPLLLNWGKKKTWWRKSILPLSFQNPQNQQIWIPTLVPSVTLLPVVKRRFRRRTTRLRNFWRLFPGTKTQAVLLFNRPSFFVRHMLSGVYSISFNFLVGGMLSGDFSEPQVFQKHSIFLVLFS